MAHTPLERLRGGGAGTYLRETILIICYLLGLAALFRAAWPAGKEGDDMRDKDPLYGWRWVAWFAAGCFTGLFILLRFVL